MLTLLQTRLPIQIGLSFLALIVLAAAAIGVPAMGIIQEQLERQPWALVEQGGQTTQAVYAELQSRLDNLALLTSQRPTLHALLAEADPARLQAYLDTLLSGAEADVLLLCQNDGKLYASAGQAGPADLCAQVQGSGFWVNEDSPPLNVFLLGVQPVTSSPSIGLRVLVGEVLDSAALSEIRTQSGLEQALVAGGRCLSSSLPGGADACQAWLDSAVALDERRSRSRTGAEPYYSLRLPLGENLASVVALPVGQYAAAQRTLLWQLAAGLVGVVLLGSLLALFLTRRISRPLLQLHDSAVRLRKGDLEQSVIVETRLSEVAQVAFALEDARSVLYHTLGQLRQEKEWVDHLLEAVVEGIVALDPHDRIAFFSQGAERISGCRREDVLGCACDDIFRTPDGERPFSERMPAPGAKQHIDASFPSGKRAALAITGARLGPPAAGKARRVLVLRDVTEERLIHRLLGDYMGNITHEFRTPLAAQAAAVELLIEQLPDLSPAEIQTLLSALRLGVLDLQTLVDNLIEGASIETGRFRVYARPTHLDEIIHEAARLVQPLVDRHRLRLIIRLPGELPQVQADPRRTVQVLVNLLANAIQHSPQDGEIEIIAEREGAPEGAPEGGLRVTVADQGPGISPADRAALLSRGVAPNIGQPRGEVAGIHGAGLGLPVVKAIVEAQGGQVGVEEGPGGGARFWFSLLPAVETPIPSEPVP